MSVSNAVCREGEAGGDRGQAGRLGPAEVLMGRTAHSCSVGTPQSHTGTLPLDAAGLGAQERLQCQQVGSLVCRLKPTWSLGCTRILNLPKFEEEN